MFKLLAVIAVLAVTGSNAQHSISKRSVDDLRDKEVLIIQEALRYINGDSTIYVDIQSLADLGVKLIDLVVEKTNKVCAAEIRTALQMYGATFIDTYLNCVGPAVEQVNSQVYALLDERIANDQIPKLSECTAGTILECLSDSLDGLAAAHDKLLQLLGEAGLAVLKLMVHITECNVSNLFEDAALVSILVAQAHMCEDVPTSK